MYIIGIDEVGRGALAGPVVAAVAALPKGWRHKNKLRDSKRLTPLAREEWFEYAVNHPDIFYAVGRVYPKKIDRINVTESANLAATQALIRLINKHSLNIQSKMNIFLDGSLYLKTEILSASGLFLNYKTLIRGDEKINAIKLASVIAKVTRDRYMVKLHKEYPLYSFDTHKGYGTKYHRRAIKKHGLSEVHRHSFTIFRHRKSKE